MRDIEPLSLLFSQLSSLHKAHSLRRKKRRNMLAIFGFRKNRSQTLSNQGPESEAEVYGDGGHTVATAPTGFVYAQARHTQEDITLGRRQNARDALYYNTPHHKGLAHSPPIFCSTVSHFLLLISSWFLYGQSAALSSINTLTNITLNLPHFFVDTRNG